MKNMDTPEVPSPEPLLKDALKQLLNAACDRENFVRDSSRKALQSLAEIHRDVVIDAICEFRQNNAKLPEYHLLILLSVLEGTAHEKTGLVEETVLKLVNFSIKEIQRSDASQAVLDVASEVLIILGPKHCNQVLSALFPLLQPGVDPNPCVLSTLGRLAMTNSQQCVPVIKSAMSIIVPQMVTQAARNESIRTALAFVVGKFCEAVLEYVDFPNEGRDDSITKETFADETVAAYNVIANSWVQAKETKVTESAISALGPLYSLLPEEKAAQATSRAVTCLLTAYKRPFIPSHLITQCLAVILQAAPPQALQPVLDQILFCLGNMIIVPPDYSLPNTVKQYNEVLRCYDHIGTHFSDRLGDLLIKHLRMGSEKDKIESLIVSAHLISGTDNILLARINSEITSAVRSTLQDPSLKVKKALVKTIVALCCKGHANDGSDFIEFLVRHCAVMPTQSGVEINDLANICASTVHLLSSTLDEMRPLLWVTLLKLLTDPTYDHAISIITKALTQIAPKQEPESGEGKPNMDLVLCRCFALLGSPLDSNRGPSILLFLQQFSPFISVHIADLWTHKLPQLINYLQGDSSLVSEWNESEWDSLLLEMINNTVTTISCHDSQWPVIMSRHLSTMLANSSNSDEASVILSSLAITTAVIEDKQIVSEHLDTIISKFRAPHLNIKECARAVGILATAHLDLVLNRLDTIAQTELNKRSSRLLGLMKDSKAEAEMEKCREIILECYAAIANRCPLMELLPKLETLSQWIMSQITLAKEPSGRDAALEALLNCAESLIRHKTDTKHSIKCRTAVLNVVLGLVQKAEKAEALPIKVITVLVKLPPSLVQDARLLVLKTCFDCVIHPDPPVNGHDSVAAQQTLKQLGELVEAILLDSVTPDRLDEITTLLERWLRDKNWPQRLSAITVLRTALLSYYHNMQPGYESPSTFNQSGDLIGSLVVRYFDSQEPIGKMAAHCIGVVLAIANVYEGHSHDAALEKLFESLPEENTAMRMSEILCKRLSHPQLHKLNARLLDGLNDVDPTACCNASDVLAAVFTLKGAELYHYVSDILGSLLLQLTTGGYHPTNGVASVIALAKHHPKLVINVLLKHPLPLHRSLSECWQAVANEPSLSSYALDHILNILSTATLFDEESKSPNQPKIAAFQPLAAVSALHEMALGSKIDELLKENVHQLIPALLTLLAAYIGSTPPILSPSPNKTLVITNRDAYKIVPSKVIKDCLQEVLGHVGCESGSDSLASVSQLQHVDALVASIPQLTVSICQTFSHLLPKLLAVFNQYTDIVETQRIVITAFYSECLAVQASSGGDAILVDSLVNCLLQAYNAPDYTVRAIALRGLSYIGDLPAEQMRRHEDSVLAVLMQGLDDPEGIVHTRIPLESMQSLCKLIPSLEAPTLGRIQVPVALRVKLFFEKEEIALRCTSLRLFGQLCCLDNVVQVGYKEQVLGSFTCILLHLSEPEPSVVKACKTTLKQVSTVLEAPKVAELIQKHLLYNGVLQFEPFVSALIDAIIEEMDDYVINMFNTALAYTKSNWPHIRGNAAAILGFLVKKMSKQMRETISIGPAVNKLLQLVKDPASEVRAKSVKALPLLFTP